MSKILFINAKQDAIEVALVNDKLLIEYHKFPRNNVLSVGDVYLGKVKKVLSTLNACFVDIGAEKDAYLSYLELGMHFNSFNKLLRIGTSGFKFEKGLQEFSIEKLLEKQGKIGEAVKKGQSLIVQIEKEPIANKGAKITSEISLAGRYLVLLPFSTKVNISKKIGNPETKKRLRLLVRDIKPINFGMIIRTVAEDASNEELTADLNALLNKWDLLYANLKNANPVKKLLVEDNRMLSLIRDTINDSYQQIICDDQALADEIEDYFKKIDPSKAALVKSFKSKDNIFDHYGISKLIKSAFGRTVPFGNGPYLIIEHTEALHVIDVNSGRAKQTDKGREENILHINLEAAKEVARQLRLRDMGGIIVVDFIDLKSPKHRKDLLDTFTEAMKDDKAKHTVLPITKFGLLQITRERVRAETVIVTTENCPTCMGTGYMENSVLIEERILNDIKYLILNQKQKGISLIVHPYIFGYFKLGLFSPWKKLQWELKTRIKLMSDEKIQINQFKILNNKGEQIILNA